MNDYKPPRGYPGIWNIMVPPGRHRKHPVPLKGGRKYRVSYNGNGDNKFLVYLPRGKVRSFRKCEREIFYSDMAEREVTVPLNTVDHNKYKYSKRNHTRALLAGKLQYKIALPGHRHLVKIVEDKVQMLNCPLN